MLAGHSPDWLPAGWTKEVKVKKGQKIEYYANKETGQKFYSKDDLIRYVEMRNLSCSTPQQESEHNKTCSENNPMPPETKTNIFEHNKTCLENKPMPPEIKTNIFEHNKTCLENKPMPPEMKTNGTPEWLPHGWIMELKTQKSGRKYKCYIDPLTGFKYYSKPEVFKYLGAVPDNNCTPQQKKMSVDSVSNPSMDDLSGAEASVMLEVPGDLKTLKGTICTPKKRQKEFNRQSEKEPSVGELTGGVTSLKLEEAQDLKTLSATTCTSKQKQEDIGKESVKEVVILTVRPDGLPPGWTKEIKFEKKGNRTRQDPYYTDPVSGYVFRSQKDALRYLETGDFSCCAIKPKKRDELGFLNGETKSSISGLAGGETSVKPEGSQDVKTLEAISTSNLKQEKRKQSDKEVVIVTVTPDGLPPGWTKEIKIEKRSNQIRKDPYYTDPVSGYVFRSQKDALRYLETGDLTSCAIKPRKRDELGFLNEETSLPSAAKMQNLGPPHATRRQLFAGTEDSFTGSLETTDAEGPRKRQCMSLSADPIVSSAPSAKTLKRKRSVDDVIEECAETEMVQEEKLASKNNNEKMQINSSKSKKNKALSMPRRSSKRISGHEPEMAINLALNERVLRDAARKSRGSGAKTPPGTL